MKYKKTLSVILLTLMILCITITASANSAQQYWHGIDSTGVIVTDGNCPIIVDRELLTFDISDFPSQHYATQEEFSLYSGKVTAEYTFYNPSNMTITATLAFPFGNLPSYASDFEENNYYITINGKEVETKIRHTLTDKYSSFEINEDLPLISDVYINNEFYNPNLTVTRYTWSIDSIDTEAKMPVHIAFDVKKDEQNRVYYFPGQNSGHLQKDGDYRISSFVRGSDTGIELYVLGEPLSTLPDWRFYKDGGAKDGEEIKGSLTLKYTETMSFENFALQNYVEENEVSKIDWYNAVITDLLSDFKNDDYPIVYLDRFQHKFNTYFMRWYQYELTIDPGEYIVNKVEAPIYPAINISYVPSIYEYTYLLSPASTWADFGNLEIVINTPNYLTDCNIDGFKKSEDGYKIVLNNLPKDEKGKYKELTFSLSTEENPTPKSKTPEGILKNITYFLLFFMPIILVVATIIAVIIVVVLIIKKNKKNKIKEGAKDDASTHNI